MYYEFPISRFARLRKGKTSETLLIALLEEFGPVRDRPRQKSCENEVKGCRKGPVVFKVIDVELNIRRDAVVV